MDEFAKKRAEKAGDSHLWSPSDALEEAAQCIQAIPKDKVQLAVHWWEELPSGRIEHHYTACNLTYADHIALLEMAKLHICDDWRSK